MYKAKNLNRRRNIFTLVPAHPGSPGKKAVNVCVCVCARAPTLRLCHRQCIVSGLTWGGGLSPQTLHHRQYFIQNAISNNNWHTVGHILDDIIVYHRLGIAQ